MGVWKTRVSDGALARRERISDETANAFRAPWHPPLHHASCCVFLGSSSLDQIEEIARSERRRIDPNVEMG
jgi:hypothetical protein